MIQVSHNLAVLNFSQKAVVPVGIKYHLEPRCVKGGGGGGGAKAFQTIQRLYDKHGRYAYIFIYMENLKINLNSTVF